MPGQLRDGMLGPGVIYARVDIRPDGSPGLRIDPPSTSNYASTKELCVGCSGLDHGWGGYCVGGVCSGAVGPGNNDAYCCAGPKSNWSCIQHGGKIYVCERREEQKVTELLYATTGWRHDIDEVMG